MSKKKSMYDVENPDWTTGFKAGEQEELDEYIRMLARDRDAATPGMEMRANAGMGRNFPDPTTYTTKKLGSGAEFGAIARRVRDRDLDRRRVQSVRDQLGKVRVSSRQRSRQGSRQGSASRTHASDERKVVTWSPARRDRRKLNESPQKPRTPAATRFFGVTGGVRIETPKGLDTPKTPGKSVRFPEGLRAPTRDRSSRGGSGGASPSARRASPSTPPFRPGVPLAARVGGRVQSKGGDWSVDPATVAAAKAAPKIPIGLETHVLDPREVERAHQRAEESGRVKPHSVRDYLDRQRIDFADGRAGHRADVVTGDRWEATRHREVGARDKETPVNAFTTALRKEVVRDKIEKFLDEEANAPAPAPEPEESDDGDDGDDDDGGGDVDGDDDEADYEAAMKKHHKQAKREATRAEDRISALEELARGQIAENLGLLEVKYELRQAVDTLNNPGGLYALLKKPKANCERRVCGAVLRGDAAALRRQLAVLSLFPPEPPENLAVAAKTIAALVKNALPAFGAKKPPAWLAASLGELRAAQDAGEPLVVTSAKLLLTERAYEKRARLKAAREGGAAPRGGGDAPVEAKAGGDSSSANHAATLAALKAGGASMDQTDGRGYAPIHHAARAGDFGVLKFLLDDLGADVDKVTGDGLYATPLILAAGVADRRLAFHAITVLLAHACAVDGVDAKQRNALHHAAPLGPRNVVELLLDAAVPARAPDEAGQSPADLAVRSGQRGIAEFVRTYRDPVRECGGALGVGKRLEFVETGQVRSTLQLIEARRRDAAAIAASHKGRIGRAGKRLRESLKPAKAKKYLSGMAKPGDALRRKTKRKKKNVAADFLKTADAGLPTTLPDLYVKRDDEPEAPPDADGAFECERGCGFRGDFDAVARHEKGCAHDEAAAARKTTTTTKKKQDAGSPAPKKKVDFKKRLVEAQHSLARASQEAAAAAKHVAAEGARVVLEGSVRNRDTYVFEFDGDDGSRAELNKIRQAATQKRKADKAAKRRAKEEILQKQRDVEAKAEENRAIDEFNGTVAAAAERAAARRKAKKKAGRTTIKLPS